MRILASGEPAAPAPEAAIEGPWRRAIVEFSRSRLAVVGLVMLVIIVAIALTAPWISPQNPYDLAQLDVLDSKLAPGTESSTTGKP